MKKHQIRMFSIKIIKFENRKKTLNDREFQTLKQRQKKKKKIEKKKLSRKKKRMKLFRNKFFQNENMNE